MSSGCRRWWMAAVVPFQMLFQPGNAGVSVTNFETVEELCWLGWRMLGVSQVLLVALHHPWGSTGGTEEWVGRFSRMVEAKQQFPLWSCPMEAQRFPCWVVCSLC